MRGTLQLLSFLFCFLSVHPLAAQQDYRVLLDHRTDNAPGSIVEAEGNNVILTCNRGTTGNDYFKPILTKTDAKGEVIWSYQYHQSGYFNANFLKQSPNGNYIIGGQLSQGSWEWESMDAAIGSIAKNGDVRWVATLSSPNTEYLYSVIPRQDDHIYVYGNTGRSDGSLAVRGFVTLLDSNGIEAWTCWLANTGVYGYACLAADGGLLVLNAEKLYKVSQAGKVEWIMTYTNIFSTRSCPPLLLKDGNVVIAQMGMDLLPYFFLTCVSDKGKVLWQSKKYPYSEIRAMTEDNDGSLLLAGKATPGDKVLEERPCLYRFSHNGAFIYGGMYRDTGQYAEMLSQANTIAKAADGRIMLTGSMHPPVIGAHDGLRPYIICTYDIAGACISFLDHNAEDAPLVTGQPFSAGSAQPIPFDLDHFFSVRQPLEVSSDTLCYSCTPPVVKLGRDTTLCKGKSLTLRINSAEGEVEWSNGSKADSLRITETGRYWVSLKNDCGAAMDTIDVDFAEPVLPRISLSHSSAYPGDMIVFKDESGAVAKHTWYFGDGDSSQDAVASHTYKRNGKYNVSLKIKDSLGCIATASAIIEINGYALHLPNAFSPGKDTLNNIFEPKGMGIDNYKLLIYNRWGEILYEGISKGWDGSFHGHTVAEGIYYYIFTAQFDTGRFDTRKGYVMLLRP